MITHRIRLELFWLQRGSYATVPSYSPHLNRLGALICFTGLSTEEIYFFKFWHFWSLSEVTLKATRGGGSITVFSTLFNKAVLLSYAFTLDPYNPMVLYTTGSLKFPSWAKSGLLLKY